MIQNTMMAKEQHRLAAAIETLSPSDRASQAPLIGELMDLATGDAGRFTTAALRAIAASLGAEFAALVEPDEGAWQATATFGATQPMPVDLLSEAADRDTPIAGERWLAAPQGGPTGRTRFSLVLHFAPRASSPAMPVVSAIVAAFALADSLVQARASAAERVERLETLLEIAGQWNLTTEMVPLLTQIAEAATRLLGTDRASIFLWDRPNRLLVGRPALGVEGNELRIPDHLGIVGQVIASGEPRRVNPSGDTSAINRQVDSKLGYQTRSLLCVPLRTSRGELLGVFEVINKLVGTFDDDDEAALAELAAHAAVALEKTQQFEELLAAHRLMVDEAAEDVQLVGHSAAIDALRSTVRRVAGTELAVLILGENGTGKEVVSRLVHYLSRRRDRPFVAVNCAAMAESLLESELFGHEKGAFTDAHETRQGKFELASGGTLFLDEIGDLSLSGQAKLLRVLEEKVVVRVGGSKPVHTDARVIAATNQDLAAMVREKRFRQDLFFRLNVVSLDLPPLRERPEDVLPLAEHFLAQFCRQAHRRLLQIAEPARRRLEAHAWPGNVRELRNLMERLVYLLPGQLVEADDLAFILVSGGEPAAAGWPDRPLNEATDKFQSDFIQRAIDLAKGNMSDAARRLGLHRSNLYRKMRQLGMPTAD